MNDDLFLKIEISIKKYNDSYFELRKDLRNSENEILETLEQYEGLTTINE